MGQRHPWWSWWSWCVGACWTQQWKPAPKLPLPILKAISPSCWACFSIGALGRQPTDPAGLWEPPWSPLPMGQISCSYGCLLLLLCSGSWHISEPWWSDPVIFGCWKNKPAPGEFTNLLASNPISLIFMPVVFTSHNQKREREREIYINLLCFTSMFVISWTVIPDGILFFFWSLVNSATSAVWAGCQLSPVPAELLSTFIHEYADQVPDGSVDGSSPFSREILSLRISVQNKQTCQSHCNSVVLVLELSVSIFFYSASWHNQNQINHDLLQLRLHRNRMRNLLANQQYTK